MEKQKKFMRHPEEDTLGQKQTTEKEKQDWEKPIIEEFSVFLSCMDEG